MSPAFSLRQQISATFPSMFQATIEEKLIEEGPRTSSFLVAASFPDFSLSTHGPVDVFMFGHSPLRFDLLDRHGDPHETIAVSHSDRPSHDFS